MRSHSLSPSMSFGSREQWPVYNSDAPAYPPRYVCYIITFTVAPLKKLLTENRSCNFIFVLMFLSKFLKLTVAFSALNQIKEFTVRASIG